MEVHQCSEEANGYLGLASALEAAGEAVVITDTHGRIQYANAAFARQTGYPVQEILGQNPRILKSGVHDDAFYRRMWDALLQGEVWRGELINKRKDGSFYDVAQTIAPVKSAQGGIVGYVSVKRDISERKRAERTIAEQQARLLESARLATLGLMAGNIAHEIHNPLAVINGSVELLMEVQRRKQGPCEDCTPHFEMITRNVGRIERIVRGLKNLAREGDDDPFSDVPVQRLIEEAVEICRPHLLTLKIELQTAGLPPELFLQCRESQVAQVLLNLLSNAADAVAALPERWIRLEVHAEDDWIEFAVTDSGSGLPDALREAIFEPFYTTKTLRGTGLGLSISKSIIEGHQGRIWVDPGHPNTRFVVRLPKRQSCRARAAC